MPNVFTETSWDAQGEKYYETGVNHGLLFVAKTGALEDKTKPYEAGVIWNGLTQVQETPSGAEANAQYADNIKYLNLYSAEEFGATIEAFTYPDEFMLCDGSASPADGLQVGQQARRSFGLAYETRVGNDQEGTELGYKLHLIYGAMASPSEKAYQTINDSPEPITFSWEITTTPVPVAAVDEVEYKPTALLVLDSRKIAEAKMTAVKEILWGKAATTDPQAAEVPSRLPLPDEVIGIVKANG